MILDDIVAYKRTELAAQKQLVSLAQLQDQPLFHATPPSFLQTLRTRPGRVIIAEVKKASPSKGVIRADFEPLALARTYAANGAAAISVLTESKSRASRFPAADSPGQCSVSAAAQGFSVRFLSSV